MAGSYDVWVTLRLAAQGAPGFAAVQTGYLEQLRRELVRRAATTTEMAGIITAPGNKRLALAVLSGYENETGLARATETKAKDDWKDEFKVDYDNPDERAKVKKIVEDMARKRREAQALEAARKAPPPKPRRGR